MNITEKEWYIQAPWGKISLIAWGNCYDPPVLLCHGGLDSAVTYRPLVENLPKDFYYIGLDLPGHGKSDWFPSGLMITVYDYVYAVETVVKHFRWENFVYVGHSMGAAIGKFYNISYPKKISKMIELDPINFYAVPPEEFATWYNIFFVDFFDNYDKYNLPKDKAVKLKRSEVISTIMKKRGFTEDLAETSLVRWSEPVGDGLVRYTFDPRNKLIGIPPFSPEHVRTIFTNVKTPILNLIADRSLDKGLFRNTKFLIDEASYPGGNYRMRIVRGGHNVHVVDPKAVSMFVSPFLLNGIDGLDSKAKL